MWWAAEQFVKVVLHLRKGRSKTSGSGEVVQCDPTRWNKVEKTRILKSFSTESGIHCALVAALVASGESELRWNKSCVSPPVWLSLCINYFLVKLLVCVVYTFWVQVLGDIGNKATLIVISKFGLQLSLLSSLLVQRGSLLRVKLVAPVLTGSEF